MANFKPMLAGTPKDLSEVKFPVLVSPKLDGVRCLVTGGQLMSRSLKPIPNRFTQQRFSDLPEGLDGELILGEPTTDPYRRTVSAVMSEDGEPIEIGLHVFDNYLTPGGFETRYTQMLLDSLAFDHVIPVIHNLAQTREDLENLEASHLESGYEGAMTRSLDGPYKQGRSTIKEGYLLKIKRFEDSDAVIIGFEERLHNGNEATTNALGHTERSSHRAGMVGLGDLGNLILRDCKTGVEFGCGIGYKADDRIALWAKRDSLIGKIVKYKFFPTGSKDKPRFPVIKRNNPEFIGLRDEMDM